MNYGQDILDYNQKLDPSQKTQAEKLCAQATSVLPDAEGKVWHGHPVWFIEGNPVFGYSLKKAGLEVLFWSGQSFKHPGLRATGKFQAAAVSVNDIDAQFAGALETWMTESREIQWDYLNLPKLRKLEKRTNF